MRTVLGIVLLLVSLLLLRLSAFTVDCSDFVYVTQFGRHVITYDGGKEGDAGLHFKWPWPIHAVQRIDRRLQSFDLPGAELLTRDPNPDRKTIDRTLTLDAYVCWRIADSAGVDRFVRTVGTPEGARALLIQRISSELGAAVGSRQLEDLISILPGKVEQTYRSLREEILDRSDGSPTGRSLREVALNEYGIEIVDFRIRRTNYPAAVRQAIFDRIVSEREKQVAKYQSEGEQRASNIRSESDLKVAKLKADAEGEALRERGRADADADRIRNEVQSLDPNFYSFLRKLEDYQRILGDNKTTLLLSTHRELFDALFNPPMPGKDPRPPGGM